VPVPLRRLFPSALDELPSPMQWPPRLSLPAIEVAIVMLRRGITGAVLDSGIQAHHPHFTLFDTLKVARPLVHRAFPPRRPDGTASSPLQDEFGHGTHIAGVIASGACQTARDGTVDCGRGCGRRLRPSYALYRCKDLPRHRAFAERTALTPMDCRDRVTELICVKHSSNAAGVPVQKGIEH
jgi:subtilisin family serine protease